MHNWQNVGTQKAKIDETTREEACPFDCGSSEHPMHFWHCSDPGMIGVKSSKIHEFNDTLSNLKTDPRIQEILTQSLYYWLDTQEHYTLQPTLDEDGNTDFLSRTLDNQIEIGWDNFLRGRISRGWRTIQDEYYKSEGLTGAHSGIKWASTLIGTILEISLDLWELQNNILHGFDYNHSQFIKKNNVTQFRHICEHHKGEVPEHYQYLLDETVTNFANRPVNYQKTWILSFNIAHTVWKKTNKKSIASRQKYDQI